MNTWPLLSQWTWDHLLLIVLASWRIATMISLEEGPYAIFSKLRNRAGVYTVTLENNRSEFRGTTVFARGLICPWCLSVWITPVMLLLHLLMPPLILWLALSTLVILFDTLFKRVMR